MDWIQKDIIVTPTATYNIWDITNINNHQGTGVYVFRDNQNNIIYVGESANIAARVVNHIRGNTEQRFRGGWERFYSVEFYDTGIDMQARLDARFLEKWLIAKEHPYFNKGYSQTHPKVNEYLDTHKECRWNWNLTDQEYCQTVGLPVTKSEFENIIKLKEKAKKKRKSNWAKKKAKKTSFF